MKRQIVVVAAVCFLVICGALWRLRPWPAGRGAGISPPGTEGEQAAPEIPVIAGDDWQFSRIDECAYAALYYGSSIRLDSESRAQVLFQRDPNRGSGLSYARFQGDAWKIWDIERECSVLRMHFALDGTDTPHALYSAFNCKDGGLKYARAGGETWGRSIVYNKPTPSEDEMMRRFGCSSYSLNLMVSDSNDLAVDSSGGVHLVYVDPESERMVYGHRPKGTDHWEWESLEKVGNHRLTVSRINPVIRVSPAGQVWIAYKRYTQRKKASGVNTVQIELRLAIRTGRQWKYQKVVDRLGFIDGQSHIMFGEANQCLIAYTRCAPVQPLDGSVKWLLVHLSDGKWVQRYEGEPREQLLTAACVGDRFNIVLTRVGLDKPSDGTMLQDSLVRLSAGADWKWTTENLLELKNRRALDAAISRHGEVHVLFASTSATSSTLERGILRTARLNRQQGAPADADKSRR